MHSYFAYTRSSLLRQEKRQSSNVFEKEIKNEEQKAKKEEKKKRQKEKSGK